jgi:hypothetical protein
VLECPGDVATRQRHLGSPDFASCARHAELRCHRMRGLEGDLGGVEVATRELDKPRQ